MDDLKGVGFFMASLDNGLRSLRICSRCKRKQSIYYRPYSGERLCAGCFTDSLKERVERTIAKFRMFERDSRIAVAVSWGKDSLNLLKILCDLEESYPRAELVAVSIDEGINGYRNEALGFVEGACKELGVESQTLSFKELFGFTMDEIVEETKEGELSPCSYCGVLRRKALNQAARKVGADRLATAHNLDDMAQTALLNIMRGDVNRLESFSPAGNSITGFVRRVKPFCEVPERESALLAYLTGINFQSISCPYAGEAMRNDVRSFLSTMEAKRPGTQFIVYQAAINLISNRSNEQALMSNICDKCGEPTQARICRACELISDLRAPKRKIL